jgi:hypothetical protein
MPGGAPPSGVAAARRRSAMDGARVPSPRPSPASSVPRSVGGANGARPGSNGVVAKARATAATKEGNECSSGGFVPNPDPPTRSGPKVGLSDAQGTDHVGELRSGANLRCPGHQIARNAADHPTATCVLRQIRRWRPDLSPDACQACRSRQIRAVGPDLSRTAGLRRTLTRVRLRQQVSLRSGLWRAAVRHRRQRRAPACGAPGSAGAPPCAASCP